MPSQLFQPFDLGGLHLSNRIVIAPMCQYSAEEGSATDWHLIHLGNLSLSGAGLLIRSFDRVRSIDRGFDSANVLLLQVDLPGSYDSVAKLAAYYNEAARRLRALPGVTAVGAISDFFIHRQPDYRVALEGSPPARAEDPAPPLTEDQVLPGYFEAMRIPLLKGRLLRDSDLAAEVTRSLFNTARQYIESFDVYCEKISFEWTRIEHEPCVLHHGEKPERVTVPDFAHLLPEPIRRFTTKGVYGDDEQHLSFIQGSGHGGSHPHMANEFVMSIVEGRPARPDAETSANWTMTGICAHESAMGGGKRVEITRT